MLPFVDLKEFASLFPEDEYPEDSSDEEGEANFNENNVKQSSEPQTFDQKYIEAYADIKKTLHIESNVNANNSFMLDNTFVDDIKVKDNFNDSKYVDFKENSKDIDKEAVAVEDSEIQQSEIKRTLEVSNDLQPETDSADKHVEMPDVNMSSLAKCMRDINQGATNKTKIHEGEDTLESMDDNSGILHVWYLMIDGLSESVSSCLKNYQPDTLEMLFSLLKSVAVTPGMFIDSN